MKKRGLPSPDVADAFVLTFAEVGAAEGAPYAAGFLAGDLRGGVVLPNGSQAIEQREALIDNAMAKLLARGHRWHRKLFDGTHASIEDLAKSENISPSFVSRILLLAYLSPALVEAILVGKYPTQLTS